MMRQSTNRFWHLTGFLLAAATATGTGGCAVGGTNEIVQPAVAAMSVCNRTANGCSAGVGFSLGTIRDLSVDVQWTHLTEGTHTETVELLEPGGGSYQVQNVSFVIDSTNGSSAQASVVFPIAGSWITQRGIIGNWNVRISLDGQNIETQQVEFQL